MADPVPGQPVVAQQSYLSFPPTLLQHVRQTSDGRWVPSSRRLADTGSLDLELQNQVCNGPATCVFGGLTTAPGSLAFASSVWSHAPVDTPVRLAQVTFVAQAPGEARLHWQTAPADPANRTTAIMGVNGPAMLTANSLADYTPV